MAKIISGGLIGSSAPKNIQTQVPMQEPTEEGWGGWALRNAVKAGPDIWAGAKSGFGIGDIEHILRTELAGDPEEWPNYVTGLPTFQEARQGNRAIFPQGMKEYGTETRPGDQFPEFLTGTGLPLLLSGGLSSGPAALQTAGMLGGSYGLGKLGQSLGEKSAIPKTGELLGSIAGGYLGGLGARAITPGATNILPTKALAPEKIIEDIRSQQKPNYDKAIALEGTTLGNANKLSTTLNDVENDLGKGMAKHDQDYLTYLINSVGSTIKGNKLSLEDAKTIKRNINDQLYEHTVSSPVKKQLTKIVGGLNDFIMENGSPEHNRFWQAAEKNTRDIKKFENQIRHVKENKESLPGIIKEGLKKYSLPGGLMSMAKYFGFDHSSAAIAGLLTRGAQRLFVEGKYLKQIAQDHPEMFDKYMDTLSKATKMDSTKVAIRINDIAKNLNKYYPEEESGEMPIEHKTKVISGGMA